MALTAIDTDSIETVLNPLQMADTHWKQITVLLTGAEDFGRVLQKL